nr:glycosyltransferase 87 family protein [Nocardioides rubriscoriae]
MASLSEVVGGPVGDHVGPRRGRGVSVLGVLLALTALTFSLGLASKTACADGGWSMVSQTRYTHACVSKVPDVYSGTGLDELAWPWSSDVDTRLRYPVTDEPAAVGLWTYAAARVTHLLSGSPDVTARYAQPAGTVAGSDAVDHERRLFVVVNAIGFAVLALLATAALSAVRRRRPWDAAGFAVGPVLAVAGVVSWDLLPVAAVAGALWAWSRGRLVLAGALVGAGAAAGVWPVLLLLALALLCLRDRRLPLLLPSLVTAVAVWALLNAPAFVTGRAQWDRFWSAAWERGPDQGSVWTIVSQAAGLSRETGQQASWLLVGLWISGVVVLVLLAPARPRLSQVGLLLVAGVLVLGLAYEPQQALWLLPLAALARPRWRDLLIWQGCEVVYLLLFWWWRGDLLNPGGNGASGFYWLAIAVHVVGTLWLSGVVARDVRWPEDDVVRRGHEELGRPGVVVV